MAPLREHHRRAITLLTERFKDDPRFPALIVGGSIVKDRARDDSDVDVLFIATDDEWRKREETGDYFFLISDITDYEGGYVDGKVVNYQFLQDAASHGSEPARSAFIGAFTAYSRIPGLDALIATIPVYPESERKDKIEAFYSCVLLLSGFFVREAVKRDDLYLLHKSCADLVFYGARLVLAHNRIIYPYHKWLMTEVARAPEKPLGFKELADAVLMRPGVETAKAFGDALIGWREWGIDWQRAVSRFIEDNEWNWREGRPPLADW